MKFEEILEKFQFDKPGYMWDIPAFLRDFFGNVFYKNWQSVHIGTEEQKVFGDNESLWEGILDNNLSLGERIGLKNFCIMEWLPASPGRYFTFEGRQNRGVAEMFINQYQREFLPPEKLNMIEGGVGSVRLSPSNGRYFLCASSNGISHQGLPLIMSEKIYRELIDEIKSNGCVVVDLVGAIQVIPQDKIILNYPRNAFKYALSIEDYDRKTSWSTNPKVTVSAIYMTKNDPEGMGYQRYTYRTFMPDKKEENLSAAVQWIEDYAVRHSQGQEVQFLTSFDENKTHFRSQVDFAISDVMQGQITDTALKNLSMKYGATFNTNNNYMGDNNSNNNGTLITNPQGPTNVSGTMNVINSFNQRYGDDIVNDLQKVADIIEKSGNHEAKELMIAFKEELEGQSPRKPILKSYWIQIVSLVPSLIEKGLDLYSRLEAYLN